MAGMKHCARRSTWPLLAAILAAMLAVAPAPANPVTYRRALRSTGWVVVPGNHGLSLGTCWLADRGERLAVTCQHVVGDSREVLVYFPRYQDRRPIVEASH